jgi:diguanylate cyclase (GGDEF)-like protein/PAS domain S-box-containing protein
VIGLAVPGLSVKRIAKSVQWLSAATLALGMAVMVARLAGIPPLPGLTGMAFSSALCLVLLGAALLLRTSAHEARPAFQAGAAASVLALVTALANLLGIIIRPAAGLDPGGDGRSWLLAQAPLSANIGFILAGAAACLLHLRGPNRWIAPARICTGLSFGIGLLAILGHTLKAEPVYSWHPMSQMTVACGAGLMLLAAALWLSWSHPQQERSEEREIVAVGTTALVIVALLSALDSTWVLRTQGAETLKQNLLTLRQSRAALLSLSLDHGSSRAALLASNTSLLGAARLLSGHPGDPAGGRALQAEWSSLRQLGYDGIALYAADGRLLGAAGSGVPDGDIELQASVAQPGSTSLAWSDGLVLRNRVGLADAHGALGTVVAVRALPMLQSMLLSNAELGGAGNVVLCGTSQTGPACLPGAGRGGIGALLEHGDQARLISLALKGASGTGHVVTGDGGAEVAAYGPVGATGLALLVQLNASQFYAPIRQGVLLGFALVAVLVLAAAIWLRRSIHALAQRLALTERRYKGVVESLNEGLVLEDAQARVLACNPAAQRMLGLDQDQLEGRSPLPPGFRTIHEDGSDWPTQDHPAPRTVRSGVAESGAVMGLIRNDGSLRWISINTAPIAGATPGERGVIATFADITERREAEQHARQLDQRLARANSLREAILDAAPLSIIATDPSGLITAVNPAAERLLRYKAEELVDKAGLAQLHEPCELAARAAELSAELGRTVPPGLEVLAQPARLGMVEEREWSYVCKDGARFPVNLSVSTLRDERGEISGFLAIAYDITERKRRDEYTHHIAHHDFLTGLPNRVLLQDRMHSAIQHARRERTRVAAMMLDLDHFKRVNDSLGHHIGDQLLKTVAARILACVRSTDTVARMGGDEFAVLLGDVKDDRVIEQVAAQIIERVAAPIEVDGHELFVTPSIGISRYPEDGDDLQALLMNADSAMYRAKVEGRRGYRLFSRDMEIAARNKMNLEGAMRQALRNGEFRLHYQPQLDLRSGEVAGMEALLRWQHPQRGAVLPEEFIPVAEESGLIVDLGEWALSCACREAKLMQQQTGQAPRVAVNLSPRQFRQADLAQAIERVLLETGLAPAQLELEITEGVLMSHTQQTVERLHQLRALGVSIAVDDFGVGFSSLSYITRFPISTLKIDRVFVANLPDSAGDGAVTQAIIALARSLGIKVVAEGVENQAQLDYLRQQGCDIVQGHYFGKAMPIDEFGMLGRRLAEAAVTDGRGHVRVRRSAA